MFPSSERTLLTGHFGVGRSIGSRFWRQGAATDQVRLTDFDQKKVESDKRGGAMSRYQRSDLMCVLIATLNAWQPTQKIPQNTFLPASHSRHVVWVEGIPQPSAAPCAFRSHRSHSRRLGPTRRLGFWICRGPGSEVSTQTSQRAESPRDQKFSIPDIFRPSKQSENDDENNVKDFFQLFSF